MKKIFEVTKWEYLEKVKTKAFIISIILTPIFMIAMGVLPSLLMHKSDSKSKKIAIVDRSNVVADKFIGYLNKEYLLPDKKPNYEVEVLFKGSTVPQTQLKAEADKLVFQGKFENYIFIESDSMKDGSLEYRGTNVSNIKDVERFEGAIKNVYSESILVQRGIDPGILKDLNKHIELKSVKLTPEGEAREGGFLQSFFTSYVFIILLMMLILVTGQQLIRSLVEEKSNRIIEILVSSCSPTELMAGKIIGLSALGLTQVIVMALMGVGASLAFSVGGIISIDNLLLILIYFLLGYIFYASIFVTVGSLATTEQEAQQLTSYVSMILVLPIVLAFTAIQDPNSSLIRTLSYIPFLTPTFMVLRIPIQVPPFWEIALTICIMLVSVSGMIWIAGKVFRIGILSYGKIPKPKELLKWLMAK